MSQFIQETDLVASPSDLKSATNNTIENLSMALSGHEYSYAIPNNTRCLMFKLSDGDISATVSYYFITGSAKVITMNGADIYNRDYLNLSGITIYFKCDVVLKTMQIETWQG